MEITKDILYVGVNDYDVDLFEGQYIVPNGMSYNSYVILDDKIAILDTVDYRFYKEWLNNLSKQLNGKNPDYLIIHHMEPDHGACIREFIEAYPDTKIVSSKKAFAMMDQFYYPNIISKRLIIENGDSVNLGKHELSFVFAPMVHWPEVFVSYDKADKVLFSADGFGKFGALDADEPWDCEARRYYIGIVGKYGVQVQNLLKVASTLDIELICPLHGPILTDNLDHYIKQYNTWSSYIPEEKGVCLIYGSMHGNTKQAALKFGRMLEEKGCEKVAMSDIAREDMAECVEDAFRYDRLILACPTYNMDIYPFMHTFIHKLTTRNFQNRKIGFIENGTWAPNAIKVMKQMFDNSKNITYYKNNVTIKSALNPDSEKALEKLALEVCSN